MASIAISWFHACSNPAGRPTKGCFFSSLGGYLTAHDIHLLSGGLVSMRKATTYISNLMRTNGCSNFTDRLSKGTVFSIR